MRRIVQNNLVVLNRYCSEFTEEEDDKEEEEEEELENHVTRMTSRQNRK